MDRPCLGGVFRLSHWPMHHHVGHRGDKVAVVDRPARRQVQKNKGPARFDTKKAAGTSYNIWYGKEEGRPQPREKSATRCVIDSDAGRTQGTADPQAWICFKFAQGKCAIGHQCRNIHCLPAGVFAKELPTGKDCFGRDRFATDREDRGGVGAFEKVPQTWPSLRPLALACVVLSDSPSLLWVGVPSTAGTLGSPSL